MYILIYLYIYISIYIGFETGVIAKGCLISDLRGVPQGSPQGQTLMALLLNL